MIVKFTPLLRYISNENLILKSDKQFRVYDNIFLFLQCLESITHINLLSILVEVTKPQ